MNLTWRKVMVVSGIIGLLAGALVLAGCTGDDTATADDTTTTQEAAINAEDCIVCHDDTNLISGKVNQYALTTHVTGRGWYYAGPRAACTNCHSSEGFMQMVATPGMGVEDGVDRSDASPMDCRTCHEIHTTYTEADWTLRTTDPVTLIASGATYDGGNGNVCASCHQPRRPIEAVDGMVNVSSTHWGPHHGPQAAIMLGVGGAGPEGKPSAHYNNVDDTCAACHVRNANHLFSPSLNSDAINNCTECHTDASNFDIDGVQTEVKGLIAELAEVLEANGMLEDGEPVVGEYPEAQAAALWNYITFEIEDGSYGVHNPKYTIDLLEYSIAAFH